MDTVIYKNMDAIYEIDKELLFTGDYNMKGSAPVPPAQGDSLTYSLVPVRLPSLTCDPCPITAARGTDCLARHHQAASW